MIIFKLPDLGEGLPDAEIRQWHVKEGDNITAEQPLVSVETAKAIVDVPSPVTGTVEKLFGQPGDTIETGQPLAGFTGGTEVDSKTPPAQNLDANQTNTTVVGKIQQSDQVLASAQSEADTRHHIRATPQARHLAKQLNIDLTQLNTNGELITPAMVKQAAGLTQTPSTPTLPPIEAQPMDATRRAMFNSMTEAHQQVVTVTALDEVDIHQWYKKDNITIRLIRALVHACQQEPLLNATFDIDNQSYQYNQAVNISLAIDTPHGLYAPVIHDAGSLNEQQLREKIEQLKQQAQQKTIKQQDLHGGSITLSNFGTIASRFANPIIRPPQVAILGAGRISQRVIAFEGNATIHPVLPLSLSIDHRFITGGESTRFLAAVMENLK